MRGGPVEDLLRGVQSLAISAVGQLSNWTHSIALPWELNGDAAQKWFRQREERAKSKVERPAGFLRGFGLPGADSRKWSKEERAAWGVDRALVQDVQDAREAQILDSETRSSQQFAAASYGGVSELTQDLQKVELEVKSGNAVSKEELGRATWTFLHTLAAQVAASITDYG